MLFPFPRISGLAMLRAPFFSLTIKDLTPTNDVLHGSCQSLPEIFVFARQLLRPFRILFLII